MTFAASATSRLYHWFKYSYCIHLPLQGGLYLMYFAASVFGKCQNRTSAWNKIRKHRSLQLYRIFCDEVFWCPQFWASLSVSETAMPRCSTAFARKGCAPANRNWITFKFINFEGLLWWNKHTKNWEPTLDSLFELIVKLKIINFRLQKFPKENSGSLWGDIFNPHHWIFGALWGPMRLISFTNPRILGANFARENNIWWSDAPSCFREPQRHPRQLDHQTKVAPSSWNVTRAVWIWKLDQFLWESQVGKFRKPVAQTHI